MDVNLRAYVLTMFSIDPFTSSFIAISLPDTLFISKTLSTSSSLTALPIPSLLLSAPLYIIIGCRYLQCSPFYSLSTLFAVGTIHLHSFAPSSLPALSPFQSLFLYMCLRYPPLRVYVSPFTVPLPLHSPPPLFLLLFSLSPAVT